METKHKISFEQKVISALRDEGYQVQADNFNTVRLKSFNFEPATVFDVGVCKGTPQLYKAFPNSKIVLLYPLDEVQEYYQLWSQNFDMDFIQCALGSIQGEITINVPKGKLDLTSALLRTKLTNSNVEIDIRNVPVRTLDSIVNEKNTLLLMLLR
jgi:FkbM family methyltransferase